MVKIELVNPNQSGGFKAYGFLNPPYNLWLVALALEKEGFEVNVIDEVVGERPTFNADVMMITTYTFSVKRALEITREAKQKGIKVMLGGIHASDAFRHDKIYMETSKWPSPIEYFPTHFFDEMSIADSVCVGEIEPVLQELVNDLKNNTLKPLYQGDYAQEKQYFPVLIPNWSKNYPLFPWQSSRGCPFNCEFCEVTRAYGRVQRTRPIETLVKEIEYFQGTRRNISIAWNIDDIMYLNPIWTRQLLQAIHEKVGEFPWAGCATTGNLFRNKDDIPFLAKTGCVTLYFGFEGYSDDRMKELGVVKNKPDNYRDLIKVCHDNNITVYGSVIITPNDTYETVDKMIEYFHAIDADLISFAILTPLLSTPVFVKHHVKGDITTFDWDKYNFTNAVIKHSQYSLEEFTQLRDYAQKNFFPNMRIAKDLANAMFSFVKNIHRLGDLHHTREIWRFAPYKRNS